MKLLHLKAEAFLRAEPEAQAEAEAAGNVPAVLLGGEGEGKVNIRQEVCAVQPPAGDGADFQIPVEDLFRNDGPAQQEAEIPVRQAAVQFLKDPGKKAFPDAAVHIVHHRHQPGLDGAAGLIRADAEHFSHRVLPAGTLFRPVGIFPDSLFHGADLLCN